MSDVASQDNTKSASATSASNAANTSQWIAEVSHELRLPIANVSLLVETLLDGGLEDPQVARRMLERAKQECDRLQSLVNDLLSVEKLSESREQIAREWVDLANRAQYALESTQKLAKAGAVKVKVKIAPGFRVYANAPQVDQVLLNLLENAIKFTPEGGVVTIKSGAAGCFSVSDTGIGMPEAEIPKIFARFYRIDRSRGKGSTGLGLSIVKHIVDLHDAKINVQSKEGEGSTFSLEFPGPRLGGGG
ncbi:MAG: hypothetical protein DKT66_14875 [Candidatus Melainabacteria bacterium]|nr:MAG: hypothetical protein DKT66_14875 [Candidatus Melainabacteria bacterium]